MGLKIGIDTSIFIYHFNDHPLYYEKSTKYLEQIRSKKIEAVFSSIGMIELLTEPIKHGNWLMTVQYRNVIDSLENLKVINTNNTIIELSAHLRAMYNIRTPDAIHIATAIEFGADTFITNDKTLLKVEEIDVKVL